MKESNNIANRFSDAYILAMLEGSDVGDVVFRYETKYPELRESFRHNAKDLELLYGHIRKSELPSEAEIARAYSKLRTRLALSVPEPVLAATRSRITNNIFSFFKARPATAGMSLGIGLAVLLAVIWQPWTLQSPSPLANEEKQVNGPSANTNKAPEEIAEAPRTPQSPFTLPEPTFRGGEAIGGQDKGLLDKKDRSRLSKLVVDNSLTAPTGLKVIGASDSVVEIRWNAVKNALSYIVEVKRANEGEFKAVSQTSQTQARISGLPSSERMEIRIIAASGERKGEASAAKNITVP
jgi:hypothetical protein